MIVQFEGGGPAQGLFKSVDTGLDEIRVGTPEMVAEGMAAFYIVTNKEYNSQYRKTMATASFAGMRKSAASLIAFSIDERNED